MSGTLFVTKTEKKYRQHDWTDATEYHIPYIGNFTFDDYKKLRPRLVKMLKANDRELMFMGAVNGTLVLSETTRFLAP